VPTKTLSLAFILLATLSPAVAEAEEKGWFGFALAVKGSGLINPTIKSVVIHSVSSGSPAAAQHITVGDEVIEIEGTPVPGHKANELKPLIEKRLGETLHLRLKRVRGENYSATMIAVRRPD
jgi:C-terminal processing protease CtpA/Prc